MKYKKIIVVLLIFLCFVYWYRNNYIFIENDFKNVFYPKNGMVQTEQDAINLCCMYIRNIYGIEIPAETLCVKYYKDIDAWYVNSVGKEDDFQILDGVVDFLIRKKDGKVLMHSIY